MSVTVNVEVERVTKVKTTVDVPESQLIEGITECVKAAMETKDAPASSWLSWLLAWLRR